MTLLTFKRIGCAALSGPQMVWSVERLLEATPGVLV